MPPKPTPHTPDDLMTAVDAARILGLSVDMVRRLAKDGRLPFMSTIRGVRLFRRGNVEELAHQRARRGNGKEQPMRSDRKTSQAAGLAALKVSRRAR
jgi:excisionase family DNA binding protein